MRAQTPPAPPTTPPHPTAPAVALLPTVAANPGRIPPSTGTTDRDGPMPTRTFYTLDEAALRRALTEAHAGEPPGIVAAGLYARAANPLDAGVASLDLELTPALAAALDPLDAADA